MAEQYNPQQAGQPGARPLQSSQQQRETFMQRQNRLYGQQSAASPVSSTGRMTAAGPAGGAQQYDQQRQQQPQQQQQQQQQHQQQQQQQQQAYQQAPPAGQQAQQQGGGVQAGAAPAYAQQPQQFTQAPQQAFQQPSDGTAAPGQVAGPAGGWQTYQSQVQIPKAQQYAPGSQETYKAAQIQQFQGPQQQAIQNQQQDMIQKLLANPYSMSEQGVSALKGQQAEQAMLMNKQQMGNMQSQLASRGIDPGSQGYGQMMGRQLGQDMSSKILDSNRNIDIQKMQTDRGDLLGALGAGTDFQNSSLQRAISGYDAGLRGSEAQRNESMSQIQSGRDLTDQNWRGQGMGFSDQMQSAGMQADEGYKQYQSRFGAQQADQARQGGNMQQAFNDRSLAQTGALQGRQMDLQNSQFGQSMGFDREKFQYGKEQDVAQQQAAQAGQDAANSRWEEEQAYQWQQDQQKQQNEYLQWLNQDGEEY
jgi:hypothetical protein